MARRSSDPGEPTTDTYNLEGGEDGSPQQQQDAGGTAKGTSAEEESVSTLSTQRRTATFNRNSPTEAGELRAS